jgi:alkylation response protein AidB-like acyl-CoA dehydrogenase
MDQPLEIRTRDIVNQINSLAPLVIRHQHDFETERRLSQPVVDAMIDADLFRLWTPRTFGGQEVSPQAMVTIVEAASSIDASFGWCLTNAAASAQMAAYLPESVARTWVSTPDCQMTGSTAALGTARRVDGGFIVSGRWPFASGILTARYANCLCKIDGEGDPANPELIICHLERAEVYVLDTWYSIGLQGSGSNDMVITERFVPQAQCHHLTGDAPVQRGQLYRFPLVTLLTLSVAIVPLGIAKAAIAAFVAMSEKTRAGTTNPFRDREVIQDSLGRAEALRRASRALVLAALDELEQAVDIGGRPLVEARANFRLAIAHCAESCLKVVEMMVSCAGAAAIFESSPLSRHLRDVQVATKHIAVAPHLFALGGRIALGMEPGLARF